MSTAPLRTKTTTLDIYIKLAPYPILCDKIRFQMRQELFKRGVINRDDFEAEVHQKAEESQRREGVYDPFNREPVNIWEERKSRVRSMLTDFYFAHNLSAQLFEQIIEEQLQRRPSSVKRNLDLPFNPELAPWELLFEQGELYEELPPPEQAKVQHHLEEIKVVLIKGMISDQLPYIGVAKNVFTINDLKQIYERRIGGGKIGGKAAGMLLAWRILKQQGDGLGGDMTTQITIPDSYYIATEVMYDFRPMNQLDQYVNQKYRTLDEIRAEYPKVIDAYMEGVFPDKIIAKLREVLEVVGNLPLIVRSSSLLEDNFGFSFAGKYDSYFCPNQGTPDENLEEILDAIRRVYASTMGPDAILYRKKHGLIDYDERMAILLQVLRGEKFGDYFFPTAAGVAFSQNPFRWSPKIRREDGFVRLVWGLGTRAVDRVDNDYPRQLSLSHPTLRPETTAKQIRQYSQHYIDVVNLKENKMETLPVTKVLRRDYPGLPYIASLDEGDYLQKLVFAGSNFDPYKVVLTFDYMTSDTKFTRMMRTALKRIEQVYDCPVDMEFAVEVIPHYPYPDYRLHILQCRPLSLRQDTGPVHIPESIPDDRLLFRGYELIPDGRADAIRYVVFVVPELYYRDADRSTKLEIGRAIGRLNTALDGEEFILMGPGRWGSRNLDLGVRVTYSDIYNTRVLIEMAIAGEDGVPDLSYGTHFFLDLVEAGIHPLPLHLDHEKSQFNWEFFLESPNVLAKILPDDADLAKYIRVIDIASTTPNYRMQVLMNGDLDEAVAHLVEGTWTQKEGAREGTVGVDF
ncbi:MAG TPA: PEP/pyruvate-binding domain-containing protein [Anaerolineae bacterium]|nr:PEP/pyruvate-binding domain-containing protein [Anaerolineae bacterium]